MLESFLLKCFGYCFFLLSNKLDDENSTNVLSIYVWAIMSVFIAKVPALPILRSVLLCHTQLPFAFSSLFYLGPRDCSHFT